MAVCLCENESVLDGGLAKLSVVAAGDGYSMAMASERTV